ncbi:unnamed protein product [Adineta steineri]|uniref:Apple domain-containing protein n=1 Tax=Adineta steineri TaxID=433720 RepID=A0A814MXX8_9BILA|nr:unnamed protein product [Adineta steineri]CAF1175478.1 unnamed protein product [Adineta steineri]
MIITQIIGEDIQSMIISLLSNSKFECANTTCSPFLNIITSNIKNCQVACLTRNQCKGATFYRSTSDCQLFDNMLNQNGNMLTDVDAISMNVVIGTRFPSEPTTTSTSTTKSATSFLFTPSSTSPTSITPSTTSTSTTSSTTTSTSTTSSTTTSTSTTSSTTTSTSTTSSTITSTTISTTSTTSSTTTSTDTSATTSTTTTLTTTFTTTTSITASTTTGIPRKYYVK